MELQDGSRHYARTAVICNADPFVTKKLLAGELADTSPELDEYMDKLTNVDVDGGGMAQLKSFIHLHAAIDGEGLPTEASADFPAQWAVIRDWNGEEGVEAPRNIVLCTMTSLIDETLAPKGYHVLHAYVPATEPYEDWENLDRRGAEYKAKKEEAADFLWKAIEEYVPNARGRAVEGTVQIGTPLTHERFLRRSRGSYGPRAVSGVDTLPGHKPKGVEGLWFCGDYTNPGIGVPAAAAGGAIVANSLLTVKEHLAILDEIKLPKR